jgi:hypothetical protein
MNTMIRPLIAAAIAVAAIALAPSARRPATMLKS